MISRMYRARFWILRRRRTRMPFHPRCRWQLIRSLWQI
uniref:Uncharacterized protein n=1 Tax=Parascaris equorum TaxID=6256 RepID=A0A914RJM9_PAREQ